MSGGSNRDWGYPSCDEDGNLSFTSYEKSGSVNQYVDNGDGGHSHSRWNNADDFNAGNPPDWSRSESNHHGNDDVKGCFLTTACMQHFKNKFDDNCYELRVLRWFRDNYVEKKDIDFYYIIAPKIVEGIAKEERKEDIYNYIFDNVVDYCVTAIENGEYNKAYKRYKSSIINLAETFVVKNENMIVCEEKEL